MSSKKRTSTLPPPEIALMSLISGKTVEEILGEQGPQPPAPVVVRDRFGLEVPNRPMLLEYDHL